MNMKNLIFSFFFLLLGSNGFTQVFRIDSLPKEGVLLEKGWKWHAGDNPAFAKADFDDSAWEKINPILQISSLNDLDINKPLWIRKKIRVSRSNLYFLTIRQSSASEIYLNGKCIKSFGLSDIKQNKTKASTPVDEPIAVHLDSLNNVLAVRIFFEKGIRYKTYKDVTYPLFFCQLFPVVPKPNTRDTLWDGFNVGVSLVLFLVYFTIFLFYRPNKAALYFSLWGLAGAITYFIHLNLKLTPELKIQNQYVLYEMVIESAATVCLIYSVYLLLYQKKIIYMVFLISTMMIANLYYLIANEKFQLPINLFTTFVYIAICFLMAKNAMKDGHHGGKFVIIGLSIFIVLWTTFILFFTDTKLFSIASDVIFHLAMLTLPITVASLLGIELRNTNTSLQKNLDQVQVLSAEKQQILTTQNEKLEKQVEERTAELKHKNHELEIEGALEKIRSTSLEMRHSGEIEKVVTVLFEKLKELNLVFDAAAIHVFKEGTKNAAIWVASPEQLSSATEIDLPYDKEAFINNPIILDVWNAKETGHPILNKIYPFEEKNRYFDYVFKHNGYEKVPEFIRNVILNAECYTATFVAEQNSLLGINSWTPQLFSETDFEILKRVAKVFEQAYVRFLDLQKAEEQAREAQIEIALERVRSKTMAMQHSNQLREIAATTLEQLKSLGFTYGACSIVIMDAISGDMIWWISGFDNTYPTSYRNTYFEHPFYLEQLNNWKEGKKYAIMVCEGEAKKAYDEYVFNKTEFVKIPEELQKIMQSFEKITFSNAYMKHGALSWSTEPLDKEYAKILQRFASVFEQSYTRFLDLQKAEEQAREAQIEAALERVRSASLAINKSSELEKVVVTLFDKIKELEIPFDSTFIYLLDKSTRNIVAWVATNMLPTPIKVNMPYDEEIAHNPIIMDLWHAIENGEHGLNKSYKEKDKDDYYQYKAKYNKSIIPESVTDMQLQAQSWTTSFAAEKNSIVGFDSWYGQITTQDDFEILKRFAKVFDQAYIRFLDLQKAEAQARESQIEASFERIRASALAMQTSEEFLGVVQTLYEQIKALGQKELEATIIQFYNIEQGFILSWQAQNTDSVTDDNLSLSSSQFSFDACKLTLEWLNAYKATEGNYTIVAKGEILTEWMHLLMKMSPEIKDRLGDVMPEISYFHFSKFSAGALSMVSTKPFEDEAKYLLKRAASAFDLAYKRYLDLQLKEEQAIKLSEEKHRLEVALKELQNTQDQLIQKEKLASLGELTAGIAHEIQNPLNFVNNFAELSVELIQEIKDSPPTPEGGVLVKELLEDLAQNQEKINHHGKRASSIVKGMLEHSRASTGQKEPTDLNALADEYLRLSYHGLRAKDKSFNADFKTDFDEKLPKINVIPQDFGRVLLNLINNAFYAVSERRQQLESSAINSYKPLVRISTQQDDNQIIIKIIDNGTGIPEGTRTKIFQPFFTTKPTGQGTGLGLSLAYDIITKGHGGSIECDSIEQAGTIFAIKLPKP
jgi:signal transduction histidine kinase